MNFLGHIYFSGADIELQHANLFGDFVKGGKLENYEPIVQKGVRLHRAIDFFMDQHPQVKELTHLLHPELPKVAGVAMDLFFDHFLAKNWSNFHDEPLSGTLRRFYEYPIDLDLYPDNRFLEMISRLKEEQWISSYHTVEGIGNICVGVSHRISFPNALTRGRDVLEMHYDLIEETFVQYMRDAISHFNQLKESY